LVQIVNNVANNYVNNRYPTSIYFPVLGLTLKLDGIFETNPHLILLLDGVFTSGPQPPFGPDIAPPDSFFTNPINQLDIIPTDFLFKSALWSLAIKGFFDMTITQANLPNNIPLQLKANDPLFLLAAPGIQMYHSDPIIIQTSLLNPVSTITVSSVFGITVSNTMTLSFNVIDNGIRKPVWTLHTKFSFNIYSSASMSGANIEISSKANGWSVHSSVASSNIGDVDPSYFDTVILIGITLKNFQPPLEILTIPQDFSVAATELFFKSGFVELESNLKYSASVPGTYCPAIGRMCPVQNTCCPWGCCTLPNASCCPSQGCCFQGEVCRNNLCYRGAAENSSLIMRAHY